MGNFSFHYGLGRLLYSVMSGQYFVRLGRSKSLNSKLVACWVPVYRLRPYTKLWKNSAVDGAALLRVNRNVVRTDAARKHLSTSVHLAQYSLFLTSQPSTSSPIRLWSLMAQHCKQWACAPTSSGEANIIARDFSYHTFSYLLFGNKDNRDA